MIRMLDPGIVIRITGSRVAHRSACFALNWVPFYIFSVFTLPHIETSRIRKNWLYAASQSKPRSHVDRMTSVERRSSRAADA